jgi:methionyl-tRNA synthetase
VITFDDFKKLEIIVARVTNVRDHPNADKLIILEVDTGKTPSEGGQAAGGKKEIVAGIKNFYSKDELIGKDIVIINNLQPVVIRGVESNGMLLAAECENGISVIMPDKPAKPGSKVK